MLSKTIKYNIDELDFLYWSNENNNYLDDQEKISEKKEIYEGLLPKIEQQESLIKEMIKLLEEALFYYLDQKIKQKEILLKAKEIIK